jgi:hypothetical protein
VALLSRDVNPLNLNRLRARRREKPRTKVGQVQQAWPEIRELIAAGHSLKDICAWVNEIGIEIGYARLSDYVGRLKRKGLPTPSSGPANASDQRSHRLSERDLRGEESDPLANLQAREQQAPGFNFSPDLDTKKLI